MDVLALYDIHGNLDALEAVLADPRASGADAVVVGGDVVPARWLWVAGGVPELRHTAYDAAGAGRQMLASGWPDELSVDAALVEPVEAIVVTRILEERAAG